MGCSQSKPNLVAIQSIEPESRPKSGHSEPIPKPKSDRIIEDCVIVWLLTNSSVNIESDKLHLSRVVSTSKIFFNPDECTTFINHIHIEKIFLILPSIESLPDAIQNLSQVEKVYIFNPLIHEHEHAKDLITLSNIFYDIDNLCQQLALDVELCELDLLVLTTSVPPTNEEINSPHVKKQEASFLYAQLKREILYRLKFENNAKNELIEFCRLHYSNNVEQLRMIDDFESNYRPQKALWWLTRQGFIQRILQRMQRTFEIDILYKLGFLLKHAHTQLTIFQENNSSTNEQISIVYRGKTMFSEKFNALIKYNRNGLLSFGNFCTGYIDREIGMEFVRRRLTALPKAVGVIFEIHVDPTIRSVRSPFASLDKIQGNDQIDKNGILFGVGAVFQIDSVEECLDQSTMNIWNVKLTVIADDDPQLLRIVAPLRSSEVHANPLSIVGKLFMEMGEFDQAERFFLGMLQDGSVRSQPRRLVRVHNGLGANYMFTGEYNKALEQYQQALNVSLSYLPSTHTDLAPFYDAIGKSYFRLGEFQKAVENYERAADLIANNTQTINGEFVSDLNTRIDSAKRMLSNSAQ